MIVYDKKHKYYLEILNILKINTKSVYIGIKKILNIPSLLIFVDCSCVRAINKKTLLKESSSDEKPQLGAGIIALKNNLVKPNDWFTIPGFLDEYLSFKKFLNHFRYSGLFTNDILQSQIKRFERKLNTENKLLLEIGEIPC